MLLLCCILVNPDNVPGAIGFQSRILPFVYPVALVKVDLTTGLLIRNKRGLCMRCGPGKYISNLGLVLWVEGRSLWSTGLEYCDVNNSLLNLLVSLSFSECSEF